VTRKLCHAFRQDVTDLWRELRQHSINRWRVFNAWLLTAVRLIVISAYAVDGLQKHRRSGEGLLLNAESTSGITQKRLTTIS